MEQREELSSFSSEFFLDLLMHLSPECGREGLSGPHALSAGTPNKQGGHGPQRGVAAHRPVPQAAGPGNGLRSVVPAP